MAGLPVRDLAAFESIFAVIAGNLPITTSIRLTCSAVWLLDRVILLGVDAIH